jgi:hypothetical protein
VSARSASTASGKTHRIDNVFESADAGVTGIEKNNINEKKAETAISKPNTEKLKEIGLPHSSYWGVYPAHISRQDGSPWPWNSFRVSQQLLFHFVGINLIKKQFQLRIEDISVFFHAC